MKSHSIIALTLACVATTLTAGDQPVPTANATNQFNITGMSCDGCAKGVAAELKLTTGVVAADVSFSNKLAVVAFDTNRVDSVRLAKVIEEAGYQAKVKTP